MRAAHSQVSAASLFLPHLKFQITFPINERLSKGITENRGANAFYALAPIL